MCGLKRDRGFWGVGEIAQPELMQRAGGLFGPVEVLFSKTGTSQFTTKVTKSGEDTRALLALTCRVKWKPMKPHFSTDLSTDAKDCRPGFEPNVQLLRVSLTFLIDRLHQLRKAVTRKRRDAIWRTGISPLFPNYTTTLTLKEATKKKRTTALKALNAN